MDWLRLIEDARIFAINNFCFVSAIDKKPYKCFLRCFILLSKNILIGVYLMVKKIYTVGHSTHPITEFIQLLKFYDIEIVVDVRTITRSLHNPQFNENILEKNLTDYGIHYIHMAGLGGFRHVARNSVNTAWRNASFRGFADYMQTTELEENLKGLLKIAEKNDTAIMCAEAVPWRCHRSLIGDALLVHNFEVIDIFTEKSAKPHLMTPFAQIKNEKVEYPLK